MHHHRAEDSCFRGGSVLSVRGVTHELLMESMKQIGKDRFGADEENLSRKPIMF